MPSLRERLVARERWLGRAMALRPIVERPVVSRVAGRPCLSLGRSRTVWLQTSGVVGGSLWGWSGVVISIFLALDGTTRAREPSFAAPALQRCRAQG